MVDEPYNWGGAAMMRQPVDFAGVDPVAARGYVEHVAHVAASAVAQSRHGYVNPRRFAKLCGAATEMVHNGTARMGLRLNGLCQMAKVGEGRVRENFTPGLRDAAALTVRILLADLGWPVLYDAVFVQRVDTRDTRSLGAVRGGVRHIGITAVTSNAACPDRLAALATATYHDPACPEADRAAIEAFECDLGHPLPSTVPAHLKRLLDEHAGLHDLARRETKLFREHRLDEVTPAFPAMLVIPELTVGTALRDRDEGRLYCPGRDAQMRAFAQTLGRPAMLGLGPIKTDKHEIDRRFPQVNPSSWRWARDFGLANPDFGVEYRASRNVLIRRFSHRDSKGRIGITTHGWELVNVPPEHRDRAIAISEHRAREVWHHTCLEEFRRRTEPGLLQAGQPRIRAGIQALEMVGNAAIVTADRRARSGTRDAR
jgi:hypothetical protein